MARRRGALPCLLRRQLLSGTLIATPPSRWHAAPAEWWLRRNACPESAGQLVTFLLSHHKGLKFPEFLPDPPSPCRRRRDTSPKDHRPPRPDEAQPSDSSEELSHLQAQ